MERVRSEQVSVLLVEDDPDLAAVYEGYLHTGFTVSTATDGHEALDRIDESIDVVLLDRNLPDMSGDQVLDEIHERGYDVPVAMVTGLQPDVDIVDMPFDEYLTKPVDGETLVRTVLLLANRTTFEDRSREFFRLAGRKATIGGNVTFGPTVNDGYDDLMHQMTSLRSEMDETIRQVLDDEPVVASHSEPDATEIETLLTAVYEHELPEEIRTLIREYQNLKGSRPPFMWKWVHRLAPQNTLPCVRKEFLEDVPIDKTLIILYITLLDDLLEKYGDRVTFIEVSKIPFHGKRPAEDADDVDGDYVTFASTVWTTLSERIERAPNHDAYDDLFRFDIRQGINAIEYSDVAIRRPELATMADLERYETHNMVMHAYADVDLMHSRIDVRNELPTIREAIFTAQRMARIGNWVSTWKRELREGDYSAGPIVYAREEGIVSGAELDRARDGPTEVADDLIARIDGHGIEERFLNRWERLYHELRTYDTELESMDLGPFIDGTEEVLRYHLASTGLK